MNWFDAYDHCKSQGGKLVEIDSEEENTALVEEIKRKGYTERKINFWIGLTDLGSEGDWRLASSGLKPSYENWHEGEPNNANGDEDCAWIRIGNYSDWNDTWSDINCKLSSFTLTTHKYNMHALCELSHSTDQPSTGNPMAEGGLIRADNILNFFLKRNQIDPKCL